MKKFILNQSHLFKFLVIILLVIKVLSCRNNDNEIIKKTHDPNKPVTLESFDPMSGGAATKVIIKGENFGSDISKIKVYFNDKPASVINSNGDYIYALAPRLPGDTCKISVVVDNDSVSFQDSFFRYYKQTMVSTLAGIYSATDLGQLDGTLASATFSAPFFLFADIEKNIFVTERNLNAVNIHDVPDAIRQINEKGNFVTTIVKGGNLSAPNAPTTDSDGKRIFIPNDDGTDFFILDPDRDWAPRKYTFEIQGTNFLNDNWKHGFAINPTDSMIYSRMYLGQIFKFNTQDRVAIIVKPDCLPQSDSYPAFNPAEPDVLYVCMSNVNAIYSLDLKTLEWNIFAGSAMGGAGAGYVDGPALTAKFREPRQICFDNDGNMFIADTKNHVIRMINSKGIVSTVSGIPNVSGYVDGDPETAQFFHPMGIAIDKDGVLYVADTGNRVIRKLSIE